MISNTNAFAESINCLRDMINMIVNSHESLIPNNVQIKSSTLTVENNTRIQTVIKEPHLKRIVSKKEIKKKKKTCINFIQPNQNLSFENMKKYRLLLFESFPWVNNSKGLETTNKNSVSVIFRVNFYDLWILIDFAFKLQYFKSKILSVCTKISDNLNRFEAIQRYSGYVFFKSWHYSTRIKTSYNMLQFISIEAIDFPMKKLYMQVFNLSNSKAEFKVSYSKRQVIKKRNFLMAIEQESTIEIEDKHNCSETESLQAIQVIQAPETFDLISSFQMSQQTELAKEDVVLDKVECENIQIVASQVDLKNDFDDFKVPITCNQFIDFSSAQAALASQNDEINYDLTQCGTKVFDKSSQVINAVKSNDLERFKQILAQKGVVLNKSGLVDLTNHVVSDSVRLFPPEKRFIDFVPMSKCLENDAPKKVSSSNKSQTSSQLNSNRSKSLDEAVGVDSKKGLKRRGFMKIGLNKQQKLKGSLHTNFLQTHINKN